MLLGQVWAQPACGQEAGSDRVTLGQGWATGAFGYLPRAGRAGSEKGENEAARVTFLPVKIPRRPTVFSSECVTLWTRHLLQSREGGRAETGPRSGLELLTPSFLLPSAQGPGVCNSCCCRSHVFTRRSEHLQSHHSSAFTLKPPSRGILVAMEPWRLWSGPHTRRLAAAWPIPG